MNHLELKKITQNALEKNDVDALVERICQERLSLIPLIRFAYDKDTLVGWRAIKAVGRVARAISGTDHEVLRVTARKLLWSLSDESGSIGWSAPELLGEIVSADPHAFADIIPLIVEVYGIEERTFRPGVVYALSRIAETAPKIAARYQDIVINALDDIDPLVRVYGIELAGIILPKALEDGLWSIEYCKKVYIALDNLKNDDKVVWLYKNNGFIDVQVGDMSSSVVSQLRSMLS